MQNSSDLFERAKNVIPGGVNSPVRSWTAVGGIPVHVARGSGCRLYTVDDRELIDFCGSWGPLILGHAHPRVVDAVKLAAESGLTFGANTEKEIEIAETLCDLIPYLDRVRLVNSGTEATMTSIRLARGYTKRDKILKFDGCYHGHSDYLLVAAGSGLLTSGIASSSGVTKSATADTLVAPYNDLDAAKRIFAEFGTDIAAVIIEPVAGNMGLVKAQDSFLKGLRELTETNGSLLIFDEVISGFRLAATSYGALCGVTPDLTCLGKIIGGGMPIGAIGGSRRIMDYLAPSGAVYQAGTLSGNPVAVAAGLATLKILRDENPYDEIEVKASLIEQEFADRICRSDPPFRLARMGGMFTLFFSRSPVNNLDDARQCDTAEFSKFYHYMISRGFYLPPSQFEVCFVSSAHGADDIKSLLEAISEFPSQ